VVKDRLRSLFRSWVPPGHRSGDAQMIKYASWISLVCSFSIFQARNDPVWITPSLVSHHIDEVPADKGAWGALVLPFSPCHRKRPKKTHKNKGVGRVLFLTHCLSHLLFLVRLLAVWFAYKSVMMMLLIVPVRVQDSRCMGLGSVSWDISVPSGVGLLVALLVVVWPVVSDVPIYDDFLDVYVFCVLHVFYIYIRNVFRKNI
jgi:hypothetical protein